MKDYKKILEGVVNIIKTTKKSDIGFTNICSYIGENCPELKESKDEKIRRCVKYAVDKLFLKEKIVCDVHKEDVLAWLEKQGTTIKFFSDEFECALGRIIAFWNQNHKDGIYDENELMSYIKGRETELIKLFSDNVCKVSLSDCSEEYRKAYYDGYNKCNRDWLKKQGEQKPAEWSEEDDFYLEHAILAAEELWGCDCCASKWLKSLRPQNHWKPTKEQLIELRHAISGCSVETTILLQLEEDLKKLL